MSGIKELILSLKTPVVFHGKIADWGMLNWSEEDWCNQLGNEPLPFRCGLRKCSANPQWERSCKTEFIPISKFFKCASDSSYSSWQYFDYKYLNQWLDGCKVFDTLSWANFGFPNISKKDCSIWIGSSGAHTPCHMDSYGCNLVAQIYGHKQWILFPPSESAKLRMTRVPYEESSVYSAWNFNSPIDDVCDSLDNIYIVTLSPGDVLYVPHHWWHYVENIDTAIAINTWLPLPNDDSCRLDEALVRFIVSQVSSNMPPMLVSEILNPNEGDLCEQDLCISMNQIQVCAQNVLENLNFSSGCTQGTVCGVDGRNSLRVTVEDENSVSTCQGSKKRKLLTEDPKLLLKPSSSDKFQKDLFDFKVLPLSSVSDLKKVLGAKCKCSSSKEHEDIMKSTKISGENISFLPAVLNSFCHPDVIKTVKKLLLEQHFNKNM